MIAGVGQNACAAHFGAGAGGGRHGDDGGDAGPVGPGPPVVDILEIPHRPALPRHEGDELAEIERRAAAEGDHPVMPPFAEGGEPRFEIGLVRIRVHLRKHGMGNAGLFEHLPRFGGDRQGGKGTVGDEERACDAGLGKGLGQFLQPAGAEADRGRVGPVGMWRGGHGSPRWQGMTCSVYGSGETFLQMEGLGAGDGLIAEDRERGAAARILAAGPA